MKFLKGLGIAFFGLLLSISLTLFGLAFTVNRTVLNPTFINGEIKELKIATLAQELASDKITMDGEALPKEIVTALNDTVADLEPLLKERLNAAVTSVYDYLLGKKPTLDLALTLRNTVLKKDFFLAVVDKTDAAPFVKEILKQQGLFDQVPIEFRTYLDPALDKALASLKPWIKEQINTAADPLLDYLVLGQRETSSVVISTDALKTSLTRSMRELVLSSPPPELALLPPAEREAILAQFLPQLERTLAAMIPSTIEINEKLLGTERRASILQRISVAEANLVQARQFITIFQTAYTALIVIILISIGGIILIHRQVRGASRALGINFLSYGVMQFGGLLIGIYLAGAQLRTRLAELPASLQVWFSQLVNHLISLLATFSLVILIVGAVLLVISFVYPRRAAG